MPGIDVPDFGGLATADAPPAPVAPGMARILAATFDETELHALPEPVELLPGALNESELVVLAGKFGTYKSFLAQEWAYRLAYGLPWRHFDAPEARPVIYVAAEGATGVRKRLAALHRRYGTTALPGRLSVVTRPARMLDIEEMAGVAAAVAGLDRPGMVVLDTWHRCTPGVEENSSTETGAALSAALSLRDDHGVTVLVVHHTGHGGARARGSSSIEDDADAAWLIRLGDGGSDTEDRGPDVPRTLVHRKSKDAELAEPVGLALMPDDHGSATLDAGQPVLSRGAVLAAALDADGVPADAGYRKVFAWAAEHIGHLGFRTTEELAKSVSRDRKRAASCRLDGFEPEFAEPGPAPEVGA